MRRSARASETHCLSPPPSTSSSCMIRAIFTSDPRSNEIAFTIAPVFYALLGKKPRLPFLSYTAEVQRLSLHARDWEEMAKLDPLWAILSEPEKRFGNW